MIIEGEPRPFAAGDLVLVPAGTRHNFTCGYCETVALLLAVGHTEADASFAVEALMSDPPILH